MDTGQGEASNQKELVALFSEVVELLTDDELPLALAAFAEMKRAKEEFRFFALEFIFKEGSLVECKGVETFRRLAGL